MTLILEIPNPKEAVLRDKARQQGLSAEEYAMQVLDRDLEQEQSAEPFWKAFARQAEKLLNEVLERLPNDGASEHDHYLYGSQKRNG